MNFDLGYRLRIRFLENDWNGIGLHMATRQQQRTHSKTAQEAKHYHPEFSLAPLVSLSSLIGSARQQRYSSMVTDNR
jgi:hypothetical protein